jgi:hypothetical protein
MSDKEIVLDENSPLDDIFSTLTMALEEILSISEKLKGDASYVLSDLTLQAIDISLLLREKLGDVSFELDFEPDEEYEPYSKVH